MSLESCIWTPPARRKHSREDLRYGSELTDAEWALVAPFLSPPAKTGRSMSWPTHEIVSAIVHVLRSGCSWRKLPDCFAPPSTVNRWFVR